MAYADYLHCAVCDIKAIYDGGVDYETCRASNILVLCDDCALRYRIAVLDVEKDGKEIEPVYSGKCFLEDAETRKRNRGGF